MNLKKHALFLGLLPLASQSWSAAYKIPEQSLNSTALSAAYIANANGADASYYNPAAMVFNEDRSQLEADLTYIHLTEIDFDGTVTTPLGPLNPFGGGVISESSEKEDFLVPAFHYVSPAVNNARFGLSVTVPAGLTKRWKGFAQYAAEEFTLKTVEINPTVGYKVNDRFSVGGGVRAVYSDGDVKSTFYYPTAAGTLINKRDLEGDSWDFGYNLALHFKPNEQTKLSATYRSKIELTVEGDAVLTSGAIPQSPAPPLFNPYDGDASVEVPIPAALNIAAAFDVTPSTTLELVYERTYWSAYDELDFDYDVAFASIILPGPTPHPFASFDAPQDRDYEDTNTYRIGLTHQYNDQWKLMAGFAYDETPVPEDTLGFELPDSDAKIYSVGVEYKMDDKLSFGGAFLYDDKDSRSVDRPPNDSIDGKFEGAKAYLLTLGLKYNF